MNDTMTQSERSFIAFVENNNTIYPDLDKALKQTVTLWTGNRVTVRYDTASLDLLGITLCDHASGIEVSTLVENVHVVLFALFRTLAYTADKDNVQSLMQEAGLRNFEYILIDFLNIAIQTVLEESLDWILTKI